jgi:hypothetical protein
MANIDISSPGASETSLKSALQALMKPPVGAKVTLGVDLTTQNYSGGATAIAFNTQSYRDVTAIHDTAVNNSRLIVPTGYTWAEVNASLAMTLLTSGAQFNAYIQQLSSADADKGAFAWLQSAGNGYTSGGGCLGTGRIAVVAGDYFKLMVVTSDTSITVTAGQTWMSIKLWP